MTYSSGQKLRANDLNDHMGSTVWDDPLDPGTTTSTAFTESLTGASPCGVAFVAPRSGKVLIHWAVGLHNTSAANNLCSFAVRTGGTIGSGSSVFAATDSVCVQHFGAVGTTGEQQAGRTHPIDGLTPGATYNVRLAYRVTAGTGTFTRRIVTAQPVN